MTGSIRLQTERRLWQSLPVVDLWMVSVPPDVIGLGKDTSKVAILPEWRDTFR